MSDLSQQRSIHSIRCRQPALLLGSESEKPNTNPQKPRSMLLSLGVPSRPSPGSDPGPVQVPSRVRRRPVQIRHVLCFTAFRTRQGPEVGAIPARPGPILVPSVPSRIERAETDFLAASDSWAWSQRSPTIHKSVLLGVSLVGRRFTHQGFAASRGSIRKRIPILDALGQIRANRVFSPIRIEICAIRVQSSLLSHVSEGRFAKKEVIFFFRSENRFARIGPLRVSPVGPLVSQTLSRSTGFLNKGKNAQCMRATCLPGLSRGYWGYFWVQTSVPHPFLFPPGKQK